MSFKRRRPHPSRTIGDFASAKMDATIRWLRLLERDLIYGLEADPDVFAYTLRPFSVPVLLANRHHHFTPDVAVHRRDGIWLHTIEPEPRHPFEKGRIERARPLVDAAGRYFAITGGQRFRVLPEAEIRAEPDLHNATFLIRFRGMRLAQVDWPVIAQQLAVLRQPTLDDLARFLPQPHPLQQAYGWILAGCVRVDLAQKLGPDTRILTIDPGAQP